MHVLTETRFTSFWIFWKIFVALSTSRFDILLWFHLSPLLDPEKGAVTTSSYSCCPPFLNLIVHFWLHHTAHCCGCWGNTACAFGNIFTRKKYICGGCAWTIDIFLGHYYFFVQCTVCWHLVCVDFEPLTILTIIDPMYLLLPRPCKWKTSASIAQEGGLVMHYWVNEL